MRTVSPEYRARVEAFDGLVESAAALVDQIDVAAFEPEVHPLVAQLSGLVHNLFLPNIDADGKVEVPPSQLETNNYMLLPLLSQEDRPILGTSMYRVTPSRLALMAKRTDLSEVEIAAVCDDFTRQAGIYLAGRRIQHDADSAKATTWTAKFHTTAHGRQVQISTRPLIAISPESADDATVLHEGAHVITHEERWHPLKPSDVEQDRISAQDELVAYHVGAIASGFRTASRPYSAIGVSKSQAEVEAYRRAHAPADEPFGVTDQTIEAMIKFGAI